MRLKSKMREAPQEPRATPVRKAGPKRTVVRFTTEERWVTRMLPLYACDGVKEEDLPESARMSQYKIMVRDVENDPVCSQELLRSKGAAQAAQGDLTPHLRLGALDIDETSAEILHLLEDGKVRTFNAICVELFDKTADICSGLAPEWALWALVHAGHVEFTPSGMCVRFRHRKEPENG